MEIDETLEAKTAEPIEIRNIYVDGKGVGDLEESIFYDREQLSLNGVVVANVIAKKNNKGEYDIRVDLESKGFTYNGGEKEGLINKTEQLREEGITSAAETVRKLLSRNKRTPSTIKYEVREALRKKFIKIIGREPVIFVCLYMDHIYVKNVDNIINNNESQNESIIDNTDNTDNNKEEEITCHTKKKKRIKKTALKKKSVQIKRIKKKKQAKES